MAQIELTKKEITYVLQGLLELRAGPEVQSEFGIDRRENDVRIAKVKKLERKIARQGGFDPDNLFDLHRKFDF